MYIGRLYPARLTEEPERGCIVTFRDIPDARIMGDDKMEAIILAIDAIYSGSDFCVKHGQKMPEPSASETGEILIPLYIDDEQRAAKLFGTAGGNRG